MDIQAMIVSAAAEGASWLVRRAFHAEEVQKPPESQAKRVISEWVERQKSCAVPPTPVSSVPVQKQIKEPLVQIEKPGCTAGDITLAVKGHLQGLSEGRRGWPVLALDVKRLEIAAEGARRMGDQDTADSLRQFAERLPDIRDKEAAKSALQELAPIEEKTWELARRCGGYDNPKLMKGIEKAQELRSKIDRHEMTRDQAINELRESLRLSSEGVERTV